MLDLTKICAYLPYNLEYKHNYGTYKGTRVLKPVTLYWFLHHGKPILHPLSSFDKFEAITDEMSEYEISSLRNKLEFDIEPINGYCSNINYSAVQKMFEKHLDVFNLIPKKLAIDINTIKNNKQL